MNLRCGLLLALCLGVANSLQGQTAQVLEKQNLVDSAMRGAGWVAAEPGQKLAANDRLRTGANSRALVKLTDVSLLRLNENTNITILAPGAAAKGPGIDLLGGAAYFLSRERPEEIRIRTPSANGILRGTEFHLAVGPGGKTTLVMFEGEVDIGNGAGRVVARSGEQVEIEVGRAPHKTAVVEAQNIIQWCLYYPGVVQLEELPFTPAERRALAGSLAAYRDGDLPGALRSFSKGGSSPAARAYAAQIFLTAGQVEKAERALAGLSPHIAGVEALRVVIAAVKFTELPSLPAPLTASDWLARSYYEQSRSRLEAARAAARQATELAPSSGYAFTRLAELEFSFGRIPEAQRALAKGRAFTPRNAHAASLGGFLLSAENRLPAARASFDQAIALDPSYGNGWLGRGLTRIRRGDPDAGRADLQAAATLEPNRSLFRSYLGKAWSNAGDDPRADRDLARAIELDPRDPTPFLYRALQDRQENRLNSAVRDLEHSLALNDNRRLYRSRLLLDQDKAVRGANLASIYQLDGLPDVATREATRAVTADYASASAHLFLAESYNALRDPRRIVLRYETPFISEQLLANLLSPVGAGPLSQFVSEGEYSKLFESDGLGFNAISEYRSNGELREIGSLYGTFGNLSFALDTEYFYDNGHRPNNDTSRTESDAKVKLQLTPRDILLLQAGTQILREGDTRQLYNDRSLVPTLRLDEEQKPGDLLLGLRHEWAPGIQTLALVGHLASEQNVRLDNAATRSHVFRRPALPDKGGAPTFIGTASTPFRELSDLDLEIETGELQQIVTAGPHTLVGGLRYQEGTFHVRTTLDDPSPQRLAIFDNPASRDDFDAGLQRLNVYVTDTFRLTRALTLIGGVTFDRLDYPDHFRVPPLRDDSKRLAHWSPKAGLIYDPSPLLRLRAAYAQAISGVSLDESTRLEPTQIAGFTQGFRTLINESVAGSVSAARYELYGLAAETKLPTGTYAALEYSDLKQEGDTRIGQFDIFAHPLGGGHFGVDRVRPGPGLVEQLDYEERTLTATLNQLAGDQWSFGAAYRIVWSEFQGTFPALTSFPGRSVQHRDSDLHQLDLSANWNHPSGLFARADALYTAQANDGFPAPPGHPTATGEPGDRFWQLNTFAGYRLRHNRGEITLGLLNLLGHDYQLEPLSPSAELPHERTLVVRCRVTF